MSFFDLFRGFFGVPGGRYRGDGQRDPFFDGMTHDDDDDEEDDNGFSYDRYQGDQRTSDDALRFGFSFGPNGMIIEEPPFGRILRDMEEMFSQFDRWEQHGAGYFGVPRILPPPDRGHGGNTLRDFMLKSDDSPRGPEAGPSRETAPSRSPDGSSSPFHGWRPFSKFQDIGRRAPENERREDRDLDSAVSSGGLDQILTPQPPSQPPSQAPSQPKTHSFFRSVTVTKVVKPDGSVEEKRTVRDGHGNEETTITRVGGPESTEGPGDVKQSLTPDSRQPFFHMKDDGNIFSRFFGGFK